MVEHRPVKAQVVGSTPTDPANIVKSELDSTLNAPSSNNMEHMEVAKW